MIFKKKNIETNRPWKRCQLEERVTRAQTYVFVIFWDGGGLVNVVIFIFFCHLKDFTVRKDGISSRCTLSVDS